MSHPAFPYMRPIEIEDRDVIHDALSRYQPQTSELTFTNFFIWRSHYRFQWCVYENWLVVLSESAADGPFLLPPIGPPERLDVTRKLLRWLGDERGAERPRIERADQRLVEEIKEAGDFSIEATRDHFDYVYSNDDLARLAGRKYHSKRNHLNSFLSHYSFEYVPLDDEHRKGCSAVTETWCAWRRCADDMNLMNEWDATNEALGHFSTLRIRGGVILIDGKVEAFTIGELLNDRTVVVHIEKANPHIRGLYTAINQQFCAKAWPEVPYINREQDLGEPGLRQAKLSYQPISFVEKFSIRLKE